MTETFGHLCLRCSFSRKVRFKLIPDELCEAFAALLLNITHVSMIMLYLSNNNLRCDI